MVDPRSADLKESRDIVRVPELVVISRWRRADNSRRRPREDACRCIVVDVSVIVISHGLLGAPAVVLHCPSPATRISRQPHSDDCSSARAVLLLAIGRETSFVSE